MQCPNFGPHTRGTGLGLRHPRREAVGLARRARAWASLGIAVCGQSALVLLNRAWSEGQRHAPLEAFDVYGDAVLSGLCGRVPAMLKELRCGLGDENVLAQSLTKKWDKVYGGRARGGGLKVIHNFPTLDEG